MKKIFAILLISLSQLACSQVKLSGGVNVNGQAGINLTPGLRISSLAISPLNQSQAINSTVGYKSVVTLSNAQTVDVTRYTFWTFSNPLVAHQNNLTATMNAFCITPGTTQVTAKYSIFTVSTKLTCTSTVPPTPTLVSISVTPPNASINVGTSQGYTATGTYSDGSTQPLTSSATWASSNLTNVKLGALSVTKDADCIHGGSSTITATVASISGSTTLTCNAVLSTINVSPATASVLVGASQNYIATCNFNDGSSSTCTTTAAWTSSSTSVATIPLNPSTSPNLATAVGAGSSTITATIGSLTGTASITVNSSGPPPATLSSIAIAPANKTINVGATLDLIATCTYSDSSTKNCSALDPQSGAATVWTSSNTAAITLQLADAIAGSAYTKTLTGTGSTPRTWSVPAKTAPAGAIDILDYLLMPLPDRNSFHMTGGGNHFSVLNGGMFWEIKGGNGANPWDGWWYDDNYVYFAFTENNDSSQQAACIAAGYASCFVDPFAYKLDKTVKYFSPRYFVPGTTVTLLSPPTLQSGNVNPYQRTTNCGVDNQPLLYLGNVKAVTSGPTNTTNWGGSVGTANTIRIDYYYSGNTSGVYNSRERFWYALGFGRVQWDFSTWNGSSYTVQQTTTNTNKVSGSAPAPNFACTVPTPPIKGLPPSVLSSASATMNLVDSTGVITGVPNAPGVYPFVVQQRDGGGGLHLFPNTIRVASNAASAQQTVLAVGSGSSTITATIGAISGTTNVTGQNPPPTLVSLVVNPATASILTTSTQNFTAIGTFSDSTQKDVTTTATWSSSNTGVATIPASPASTPNTATPVAAGSTTITAAVGSVSNTATLTVTNPGPPPPTQTGVTLAPKPCAQVNGGSCSYTLTENFSDGSTKDVTLTASAWTASSPSNVQMASPFTNPETGKCLVGGGATSTITGSFGGFSDNTTQTCNTSTPVLQTIAVTPANQSTPVGSIVGYTATGTYSDGSTKNLTSASAWTSSNTSIATVQTPASPQPVICNAAGTVTVKATSGAVSGNTQLTCSTPVPPNISMDGYCPSGSPTWGSNDGPATLPATCFNTNPSNRPTPGTVRTATSVTWNSVWSITNCDDVVEIAAVTTLSGTFTIPTKVCPPGHYRTLRVANFNSTFPAYGSRATPAYWGVASLPGYPAWPSASNVGAAIATSGASQALILQGPISGLQIEGMEFTRTGTTFFSDIITKTGTGFDHIIFDRDWCEGTAPNDTSRCFNASGVSSFAFIDSAAIDFTCKSNGNCVDAQALSDGLNNSGVQDATKKVVNNFMAATAQSCMLSGGGSATIVPNDLEFRLNWCFKPMTWNPADPAYAGVSYQVKNSFELKNFNRVLIEGNIFQNAWVGADQNGSLLLFTPKSQAAGTSNLCPICTVTNTTLRYNYATTGNYFLQVALVANGNGAFASGAHNLSINNNVADNLGYATCSKCSTNVGNALDGGFYSGTNAPNSLNNATYNHNDIIPAAGAPVKAGLFGISGPLASSGIQMTNYTVTNIFAPNQRGGSTGISNPLDGCAAGTNCNCGTSTPTQSLNACFASYQFTGNCIVSDQGTVWPGSNVTSGVSALTELVNYNNGVMIPNGDFHLKATSACHNAGSDGLDPGADIDTLLNRIQGVNAF